MSKIICEICGTKYAETAPSCPICGWKQNGKTESATVSEDLDTSFLTAEPAAEAPETEQNNEFDLGEDFDASTVKAPAGRKKDKEVFDYDAVNSGRKAVQVPEEDEEEEEEQEEEESHTSGFLVFILVILIVALLLTSGFIFWKYYLPGMLDKEEPETTAATVLETEEEPETTEPVVLDVPCTGLSLVSGMENLTYEGQNWLLHVKASPEDTTDAITFQSDNEQVATVNEEGRVTAVGEGSAKIIITCGEQKIECPVVVSYQSAETTAPTESLTATEVPDDEEETEAVDEDAEDGEDAEEAEEAEDGEVDPDVVLKLKRTDITLGRRGVYATLELDCDLKPEQVKWSTRNAGVATVNAKGDVTCVGPGLTVVTVTYGSQEVECIVRCNLG